MGWFGERFGEQNSSRYKEFYFVHFFAHSRGIPAEICKELSDNDIVGEYLDFVTKYVLWDDVLDWERDIKDYGKKKKAVKGQHRLV